VIVETVATDTMAVVAAEDTVVMTVATVATVVAGNRPAHQPVQLVRVPQLAMPQTLPPSMPNTMVLTLTLPTVDTRITSPTTTNIISNMPLSSSNSPRALLLLPGVRHPLHPLQALGLLPLHPVPAPPVLVQAATARYVMQCALNLGTCS